MDYPSSSSFNHENLQENPRQNENFQLGYTKRVQPTDRQQNVDSRSNLMKFYETRMGGNGKKSIARYRSEMTHHDDFMEKHADLIVGKMEQDPLLMEDTPIAEDLRRQTLRDMPQCLTLKRSVKVKLQKSVSKKSKRKQLGLWKRLKYRTSISFSKFKASFKNFFYCLELWYDALKTIEGNFGSGASSFFKFLRLIFIINLFVFILTLIFIILPQIIAGNGNIYTTNPFDLKDIFTGEGSFSNSILYYGFYTNQNLNIGFMNYSMPHAYFFTMLFIFLVYMIFFSVSAAKSYRKSYIETEGGFKNVFAHKIFCSWDYSIATKDAAALKSHSIYNELRELLSEQLKDDGKRTCSDLFYTISVQVIVNILVVLSLVGTGYLMWFLMESAFQNESAPIYCALTANAIMTLYPIVFNWIVRYEDYRSPKVDLYLTLFRTFVLGFVIIGVLMSFWLKNTKSQNWETSLAQEIYRMILFDFIFAVIVSPLLDVISYFFLRFTQRGHLHFDISKNTMQIIYNQCLYWVGLMFSPLLPAIITIKLFIIWYAREIILLKLCKPSTKTWRATQMTAWFLMITLLGLLLVLGLVGYVITSIPATKQGPFKDYDYIYEIVTLGVLNLKNNSDILNVLLYATKPGFIALILIGLCGRIYYIRARANSLRDLVKKYREMLIWEAKDKEFLINRLGQITNGKWEYKVQEGRLLDPIISAPTVPVDKNEENFPYDGSSSFEYIHSGPSTMN